MKKSRVDRKGRRRCSGQATAEVVIGMVGLTVVFFAVTQIGLLGLRSIENYNEARTEAEDSLIPFTGISYVEDWEDGDDALRFTADDKPDAGTSGGDTLATYSNEFDSTMALNELERIGGRYWITPLCVSGRVTGASTLAEGSSKKSVNVENALVRFLALDRHVLELEDKVYMPDYYIRY